MKKVLKSKKRNKKIMITEEKSIMIPTLTESFKKTKEMIKWWMENSDAEGNINITTEDIIKQKEKDFELVKK